MSRAIAVMTGIMLAGHGLFGLLVEGEYLMAMFNADIAMDVIYLGCAVALFAAVLLRAHPALARLLMAGAGGLLVLIAIVAIPSADLLGLAPTGFTGPDFIVFYGLGGALLIAAVLPDAGAPIHQADPESAQPAVRG